MTDDLTVRTKVCRRYICFLGRVRFRAANGFVSHANTPDVGDESARAHALLSNALDTSSSCALAFKEAKTGPVELMQGIVNKDSALKSVLATLHLLLLWTVHLQRFFCGLHSKARLLLAMIYSINASSSRRSCEMRCCRTTARLVHVGVDHAACLDRQQCLVPTLRWPRTADGYRCISKASPQVSKWRGTSMDECSHHITLSQGALCTTGSVCLGRGYTCPSI
jgi:hypothetical protein